MLLTKSFIYREMTAPARKCGWLFLFAAAGDEREKIVTFPTVSLTTAGGVCYNNFNKSQTRRQHRAVGTGTDVKTQTVRKTELQKAPPPHSDFILVSGIYRLAIHFYLGGIVHVYCIGAGVLAVLYIIINRGMLKKPEKSDLPDTMSDSEKDSFIAGAAVRRERSEFILYILFSLILSVMIDLMYIWLTVNQGVKLP